MEKISEFEYFYQPTKICIDINFIGFIDLKMKMK